MPVWQHICSLAASGSATICSVDGAHVKRTHQTIGDVIEMEEKEATSTEYDDVHDAPSHG